MNEREDVSENTPEEELESTTNETEEIQDENLDYDEEPSEEPTEETVENNEKTEEPIEDRKPSRAEKRIRQLATKNRELLEQLNQNREIPTVPQLTGDEIDVNQLDEYINQRANQVVEFKLQQQRGQDDFKKTALDWADDLEKVVNENPELDPDKPEYNQALSETLSELIEKSNFDDQGRPTSRIKVSAIWGNLQKVLEGKKSEGGEYAAKQLQKQIAEGAISPSSKSKTSNAEQDEFDDFYKQDMPPGFSV